MRKLWYAAAILASVTALTGPSFSMGGGGGGGGGGGSYGGSGLSSGTSSTDDYTVALRLIKHQRYADAIPQRNLALAVKTNSRHSQASVRAVVTSAMY